MSKGEKGKGERGKGERESSLSPFPFTLFPLLSSLPSAVAANR
jgi:hypothetical protein